MISRAQVALAPLAVLTQILIAPSPPNKKHLLTPLPTCEALCTLLYFSHFSIQGVVGDPVLQGIIPRIVQDMFDQIYAMDSSLELHIKVNHVQYMYMYM